MTDACRASRQTPITSSRTVATYGQVAVLPAQIEPVPHQEPVGGRETPVLDRDVGDPARRLVDECADLKAPGLVRPEQIEDVVDGQPGVDDVFDEHAHGAPVYVVVEVLGHADDAARPRARTTRRPGSPA